jgi:hypothetical protein
MISVATSLVLLPSGYEALLRRGLAGFGVALALLAIFVAGNAAKTINLLRFGRGQYLSALHFMEINSDGREVVITSDHDFRNGMFWPSNCNQFERRQNNNSVKDPIIVAVRHQPNENHAYCGRRE